MDRPRWRRPVLPRRLQRAVDLDHFRLGLRPIDGPAASALLPIASEVRHRSKTTRCEANMPASRAAALARALLRPPRDEIDFDPCPFGEPGYTDASACRSLVRGKIGCTGLVHSLEFTHIDQKNARRDNMLEPEPDL